MKLLVLVLITAVAAPVIAGECTTSCSDGYRAVCVERGEDCRCSCVKTASEAPRTVRELLRAAGASEQAIQKAVQLVAERIAAGEENFKISFTSNGERYTITLTTREPSAGSIIVTDE
jgi:hypothetical protein